MLYFYPKADTPGCTKEACAFQEALPQFGKIGLDVIGVSPDKMKPIEKFAEKYKLTFPLASDETHAVAEAYGTWVEKSMYGRNTWAWTAARSWSTRHGQDRPGLAQGEGGRPRRGGDGGGEGAGLIVLVGVCGWRNGFRPPHAGVGRNSFRQLGYAAAVSQRPASRVKPSALQSSLPTPWWTKNRPSGIVLAASPRAAAGSSRPRTRAASRARSSRFPRRRSRRPAPACAARPSRAPIAAASSRAAAAGRARGRACRDRPAARRRR